MTVDKALLLLHTEADGRLSKASLEALGCALQFAELTVGLVGGTVQGAADSIGTCGAARMLAVEGEDFAQSRYATDAAAAEAICRAAGGQVILAPGTSRWSRALPGVAQRIGARVDSHVNAMASGEARRWLYRNRIEVSLRREAGTWMVLLDGGAATAWSGAPAAANVERLQVTVDESLRRTGVVRVEAPEADQQTIRPDAKLLLVAGAGWTKKQKDGKTHTEEAGELIQDIVRLTQASLGSSKSLVDLGSEGESVLPFLTHLHQVGQTGSSPRHAKGLATCCHGEEPHVVGWRFIHERRAINLDAGCGWARRKADVLYVADAFEVLREMRNLLGARSAKTV